MRLATCNLLHGIDVRRLQPGSTALTVDDVDLDACAEWIADLDADVVCLQEVDRHLERSGGVDQVAWLAEALGYEGTFCPALHGNPDTSWLAMPTDGQDPGGGAYGVGILSRVGLGEVRRVRLPYGGSGTRQPGASPSNPGLDSEPRVVLSATVADGMRVSTTHLSYMFWWAVPQLGRALEAAAHGHRGPGLLLGDLNLPMWGGWLALHGWGLHPWGWPRLARRSAGWRHHRGEATYPSWNPRLQLDQAYARHVRGRVEVTSGPAGPSDHLPLLVEV